MRLRLNGEIIRSDTNELSVLKNFHTFGDYSEYVDKIVVAAANTTTVVDMDDIGTASFVALFVESTLSVRLNGSNVNLPVSNFIVLADSEITSLSLVSTFSAPTKARVIMAG
jgi:hypothetical protein